MKSILLISFSFLCIVFAAKGDFKLAQMIDTAILEAKQNIETCYKNRDGSFPYVLLHDCFDGGEFNYPQFAVAEAESWYQVLSSGKLNVGISSENGMKSISMEIMKAIAAQIQNNYKTSVQANFMMFGSETEVISALTNTTIHVAAPSFTISSIANSGRIRLNEFRQSCSTGAMQMGFYTFDETLGSVDEIITKSLKEGLKILVSCLDEGLLLQNLYGISYQIAPPAYDINSLETDKEAIAMFSTKVYTLRTDSSLQYVSHPYLIPIKTVTRQEAPFDLINTTPKSHYEGNLQLRSQIDFELSRIQTSVAQKSFLPNEAVLFTGDCAPASLAKSTNPIGTYGSILGTKKITIGYPLLQMSPILDTTQFSDESKNQILSYERSLVQSIDKSITIEAKIFSSFESLFSALDDGEIDVTSAALPLGLSSPSGIPLRYIYDYSCSAISWSLLFIVDKQIYTTVGTFEDIIELMMATSPKPKIVTSSSLVATVLIGSFGSDYITFNSDPHVALSLLDSSAYIAFVPDPPSNFPSNIDMTRYTLITSPLAVPLGMFFRRDKFATKGLDSDGSHDKELVIVFSVLFSGLFIFAIILLIVILCCCGCLSLRCCCCCCYKTKNKNYDKFEDDEKDYAPPSIAF